MPRHLNVSESIFSESKSLIENWLDGNGSELVVLSVRLPERRGGGPQPGDDPAQHDGAQEHGQHAARGRSAGGATRPELEAIAANNRRRKTYSAIYTMKQLLDYYRANFNVVQSAIKESIQFQKSNTGRIVFGGSYDVPAFPAPHPGEAPPPAEPPEGILDPPPCGYLVTDEQMASTQDNSIGRERLAAHGIKVQRRGPLVRADEAGAARARPAAPRR